MEVIGDCKTDRMLALVTAMLRAVSNNCLWFEQGLLMLAYKAPLVAR